RRHRTAANNFLSNTAGRRVFAGPHASGGRQTNKNERSPPYGAAPRDGSVMQTIIISFLFGVACAMMLWAAGAAAVTRDRLLRDYGFSPSGES
ncbi:MAG: hypothetical protein WBQ24_08940, partial [Xanthobacteraceae bacterium]